MRRESARLQPGKLRAVAVFAVTETERPEGRPESYSPAQPQPQPPTLPLRSRGVERRTSQPPLAWGDTTVLMGQKLGERGRPGGREGGSREMATFTKYFLNQFLQLTRNEIIWLKFHRKTILTGKIWVTHPQSQYFFGWQFRKLKSSSQDYEIYFSLSQSTLPLSLPPRVRIIKCKHSRETPGLSLRHHHNICIWLHIECFHDRQRAHNHFVMQKIQLNIWHRAKYFW